MEKKSQLGVWRLALIGMALFGVCSGCSSCSTGTLSTSKDSNSPASEASTATDASPASALKPASGKFVVPYYPPPDKMDLCGEPVPLDHQEVLERFDKEFTLVVYNHAQIYLWLKRMERYFPWIEERLRSHGLPDDLKYVAIVESDLLPNACSPKGAAGPWQFMPSTGSAYGLSQTALCDERYDFELATDCAFRYLSDLYGRYKNWTLAIATYNCGDKRILEQTRLEGTSDYYKLKLPTETERYIFRILALKAVLNNPARYGYNLPKGQGYPELRVDRVNLATSCPIPVRAAAEAAGTTYRELKRLNPALRGEEIPAGAYQVKVPQGTGGKLQQGLDSGKIKLASEDPLVSRESKTSEPQKPRAAKSKVSPKKPPAKKASGSGAKIVKVDRKPAVQNAKVGASRSKASVKAAPAASSSTKKGKDSEKQAKNKKK